MMWDPGVTDMQAVSFQASPLAVGCLHHHHHELHGCGWWQHAPNKNQANKQLKSKTRSPENQVDKTNKHKTRPIILHQPTHLPLYSNVEHLMHAVAKRQAKPRHWVWALLLAPISPLLLPELVPAIGSLSQRAITTAFSHLQHVHGAGA